LPALVLIRALGRPVVGPALAPVVGLGWAPALQLAPRPAPQRAPQGASPRPLRAHPSCANGWPKAAHLGLQVPARLGALVPVVLLVVVPVVLVGPMRVFRLGLVAGLQRPLARPVSDRAGADPGTSCACIWRSAQFDRPRQ